MFDLLSFLPTVLSSNFAKSARRILLVLSVVLFCWVTSILVEPLTFSQIVAPVAWAQAESPEKEGSLQGNEQESPPAEEGETVPAVEPEIAPTEGKEKDEEKEEEEIEDTIIDRIHAHLSGYVSGTADRVDRFFDDERYSQEVNRTRVKLQTDLFFEQGEDPQLALKFGLSLALPRINKRLRLLFSGQSDSEEEVDDETGTDLGDDSREGNAVLGVAYDPVQTAEHNVSLRAGLRFKTIVPALWIGPRWRAYSQGEIWGTRLANYFRWFTDTGFRLDSSLDFERGITENFFYRQTLRGKWDQDKERYDYDIVFSVFQKLERKRSLRYEYRNRFRTTTENQLHEILLKVTYRQSIWRRWLFFEVAPQASFPEEDDFDFTPGILFRLESIIGKGQLRGKKGSK